MAGTSIAHVPDITVLAYRIASARTVEWLLEFILRRFKPFKSLKPRANR
jgi:hypothetical protein